MAGYEQLKPFGYAGHALFALCKRRIFNGIIYNERGLDKLVLNKLIECKRQKLTLCGRLIVAIKMYLFSKLTRLLVRFAGKEVGVCVLLHGVAHGKARKRGSEVYIISGVLYLCRAVYKQAAAADKILAKLHHSVIIGVSLIYLYGGELRIVRSVHTLVAEKAAYLIHPFKPADYAPFKVQLGRYAQVHVYIQRIVVGDEGPCAGSAGCGIEHGSLYLYKVKLVEPAAYLGLYLSPFDKRVPDLRINYKVN